MAGVQLYENCLLVPAEKPYFGVVSIVGRKLERKAVFLCFNPNVT